MPENSQIEPRFYEFGDYSLDAKERVLRREGESLFLPPKVFDTLLALVRQSGHLVERDSLLEEVWADTFVEEANLTVNISALRKVLGTNEKGKSFIETVPRRGYRFAADVTELPDDAEIVVRRTRAKISITTEEEPQTLQETNPISKSLAVLPFQMLGGDSNAKFLGLGLADALIMQLGRQQQMLVRPTSAIREFAEASQSSIEIGRKLEVGAVLEGSFQVFNERLRLTVQLFDVEKSSLLWSETFNVHFTDIFEVQDEISKQIADLLLLKLTGEERSRLSKQDTQSGEAYLEYLKGRYFWDKRDIPGFGKAIEHFKKAIDFDPTYALAYSGLADVYCLLGVWGEIPPREIFPRARAAAQRALEIDGNLAEAHASLGQVKYIYDWDWKEAEKCYRQAMWLNPNYATVHSWLAKIYTITHRFEEALNELKLAQNLDPLSLQFGASKGAVYLYSRQYDECIEQLNKVLEINPDFVPALITLGNAFAQKGMFDEAMKAHEKAAELSNNHLVIQGFLAGTLALFGEREKALEIVEKLKQNLSENKSLTYSIAAIYARLNEKDESLAWLERAFQEHDCNLPGISMEVEFENLRGDARFDEMLRRLGLYRQTIGEKTTFLPVKAETTALTALPETKTLAVLPFLTLGLQREEEYLGLGLADALITQLSQTRRLTVRPTSGVQKYAGGHLDSAEIGRELRVRNILEGSLQRAGERLRVTVRLIETESENALWAEKFDINFSDIFAAEDEITTRVAEALFLNLSGDERRRIENRVKTSPEAYKAYLQGRYFWNKFIPEYVPKAIEAFETAISLDPNFAQAYAGIARAYRYVLGLQSIVEFGEAKEKMLRAAVTALALDDSLAEAHLAIAEIKKDEWDWKTAESEYKRAIVLNPNLAEAYAGYADFLSIFERSEEAFIQIERALELDPLSSRLRCGKGKILFMARRYDEAAEFLKRAVKAEPNDALTHYSLGYAYACKKMFPEAIVQYKKALAISDASPDEFLGYAYAKAGQPEAALEILNKLKDKKDASPAELSVIYIGLGDREAALAELEKGYEMHDLQMQYLRVEQHYDDLRNNPRFAGLLKRVGLDNTEISSRTTISEQSKKLLTDQSGKMETLAVLPKTADAEIAPPTSSAEYIVTEIKRHKRGTIIFLAILALILAGAAAFYFYRASRQPTISSIAVLPFSNRSGDENLEYLSDGLSESINAKLAQIGQLKVIAQSSAFRYKNKEIDPKEIGQTLGVEALLTGNITKSGEGLSITVELVNTKDGTVIWNEKYNLDAPDATTDAQLVQTRIAVQTVKNLNLNLTEIQDKQLMKYATQNANAYQLYLNAALLKRKGNTLDLHRKAIDFYNQATAFDPEFALAYASLADSYRVIHSYEARPNSETRRKIEEKMYQAIRRARELDPMLPEVYITLGGIKMNELDLQASEQAYLRALELNPNSPAAHSGYVNYLTNTGRFDEALTHVRLAQQLDPLNLNLKILEGRTLFVARRFDEAIRLLQNLAKTAPENPLVRFYLAQSYLLKGMTAESLAEHEKIRETEGDRPTPYYIFALAKAGKTEAAREQLEKLRQSGDYAPAEFAIAYIGLGEKEQAFTQLEKAYQERDPQLQYLKIDPLYDEIRDDPRFLDLLRRVGLD